LWTTYPGSSQTAWAWRYESASWEVPAIFALIRSSLRWSWRNIPRFNWDRDGSRGGPIRGETLRRFDGEAVVIGRVVP